MDSLGFPSRPSLFSRTLRECRQLYVTSGELMVRKHAGLIPQKQRDYVQLMDDLHRGLAMKIYITVCEADKKWSSQERLLAEVLCHHLWGQWLEGDQLRDTMKRASTESAKLEWRSLINPFVELPPLRDRVGELETLVTRLSNLVARCDGALEDSERQALDEIRKAIFEPLPAGLDNSGEVAAPTVDEKGTGIKVQPVDLKVEDIFDEKASRRGARSSGKDKKKAESKQDQETPPLTLEEALEELDKLIGLGAIKHEVRSLANFLKLQQKREEAGLPTTDISLHMVFTGNPGTGKTTVARIVGKIFGALGVLEKGHLVETDRSGLVAEYAGQTGPKTNAKVDESLGGLLFVDEAYSLVAIKSEDPYGREAMQALLKRAEDDRDKLVVILAGYTHEMHVLLRSNPGLSSRFSRQLEFVDYTPLELSQIFGLMCNKNRYQLTPAARLKVMLGLRWLYDHRDRHFGNGRTSRNLFEHAVRRMANRLAGAAEITQEQLVTLEREDIEFTKAPAAIFEDLDESQVQLHVACPGCEHSSNLPLDLLGKRVKCPKCQKSFEAEWGDLQPLAPAPAE
ncbi:MAG: AAA family ATPase [Planctomycetales bacterium]|nr:AAA family ATPase [Planctomycetales bacterium]